MNSNPIQELLDAGRVDLLTYGKSMLSSSGYIAGQMELTSACEQRCGSCQSWIDHTKGTQRGEWSLENAQQFFLNLRDIPTFEHLSLTGGDPQSWPHLEELLLFYHRRVGSNGFRLRMNTALPLRPSWDDQVLWKEVFHELRISLDGVHPDYYRRMRGVERDPEEIFRWLKRVDHDSLVFLTCVSQKNIDHVLTIMNRIANARDEGLHVRKAIFIPIRDMNDRALLELSLRPGTYQEKWAEIREFAQEPRYAGWTSLGEQVEEGELSQYKGVDCHVSKITFHVKYDGTLYPCCLMGGEAIATRTEFAKGNVIRRHIDELRVLNQPVNVYDDPESPCTKICLWKQASMNRLGNFITETHLSMP
jgi:MoaA/NifB/PqqE/SkfB family radical SAM enzyme